MKLFGVDYVFKDENRTLLVETDDYATVWDVEQELHPAIRSKNPTVTLIGDLA